MSVSRNKSIKFPASWGQPKYRLGQFVEQGQIIGVEYCPPRTKLSLEWGEGWTYWVLTEPGSDDLLKYEEGELQPLNPEDIKKLIQEHEAEITTLKEQLR
ncbi:hypothetical protein ACE1AT_11135 [Pelatocladus sp. BLCC-F211]|uniref:hypothetical protein n=1 Tax=Pelatocladus sp. BLCC-F211 TaxID=3342752 RepID=UPI0035BAF0E5